MAFKLIIAGDRDVNENDLKLIEDAVDASGFKPTLILSGAAAGGDKLGEAYAKKHKLKVQKYPADWKNLDVPGAIVKDGQYGKYNAMAGFMRNQLMAEQGDALIALQPNGSTAGTSDMIKRAKEQEIPVFVWPVVDENKEFSYTF